MDDVRPHSDDEEGPEAEEFPPPRSRYEGFRAGAQDDPDETPEAVTAPIEPLPAGEPWEPTQPWAPPRPKRPRPPGEGFQVQALFRGWGTAVLGAVVTTLVLGLMAELASFLIWATEEDRPSPIFFARIGGALFHAFHKVAFTLDVPEGTFPQDLEGLVPTDLSASMSLSIALMTGTVVAVWLLSSYARMVANRVGGSRLARGLHGTKVALPYAAISLAAAYGYGVGFSFPVDSAQVSGEPSYVQAFAWPLLIGAGAGFLGGFLSLRDRWGEVEDAWLYRVRGALAGGVAMMGLGLFFSFVGLLVLAAVKPDATSAYFNGLFDEGVLQGIAGLGLNLLVVPNMAAWVLFPAMGSCLSVAGGISGAGASFCLLSYSQFPSAEGFAALTETGPLGGLDLPGPPAGYFLFLLAPFFAVLAGGFIAAWKGAPETRVQAAGIGALAGVAFAFLSLVVLFVATAGAEVGAGAGGRFQSVTIRVGPDMLPGFLLSLLWGLVGGAVGGFIRGRAREHARRPAWEVPPGGLPPGY